MSERTLSDWHRLLEQYKPGFADEVASKLGCVWHEHADPRMPGQPKLGLKLPDCDWYIPPGAEEPALVTEAWEKLLEEPGRYSADYWRETQRAKAGWAVYRNSDLTVLCRGKWADPPDHEGRDCIYPTPTAALAALLESMGEKGEDAPRGHWGRISGATDTGPVEREMDTRQALLELREKQDQQAAALSGHDRQFKELRERQDQSEANAKALLDSNDALRERADKADLEREGFAEQIVNVAHNTNEQYDKLRARIAEQDKVAAQLSTQLGEALNRMDGVLEDKA